MDQIIQNLKTDNQKEFYRLTKEGELKYGKGQYFSVIGVLFCLFQNENEEYEVAYNKHDDSVKAVLRQ